MCFQKTLECRLLILYAISTSSFRVRVETEGAERVNSRSSIVLFLDYLVVCFVVIDVVGCCCYCCGCDLCLFQCVCVFVCVFVSCGSVMFVFFSLSIGCLLWCCLLLFSFRSGFVFFLCLFALVCLYLSLTLWCIVLLFPCIVLPFPRLHCVLFCLICFGSVCLSRLRREGCI